MFKNKDDVKQFFSPKSEIYKGHPVLIKQVKETLVRNAPIELLRDACRVCNTNIDGLMDILGVN